MKDNQRKAMFAKIKSMNNNQFNKVISQSVKNKNITKKSAMLIKRMDFDGDGVSNSKDCRPFDAKKQGFLHNLNIKILKAQEQRLEDKRKKEQKKLEDTLETLKVRQKIAGRKTKIKNVRLREKQAFIDELNKEKRKTEKLKIKNQEAKRALDKLTFTGKAKSALTRAGKTTLDRKSTRLNSSHIPLSRMPSSA